MQQGASLHEAVSIVCIAYSAGGTQRPSACERPDPVCRWSASFLSIRWRALPGAAPRCRTRATRTSTSAVLTWCCACAKCRYWYEVQRVFWQGKLGNLVLLPLKEAGAKHVAAADYDTKAAFYQDCGAAAAFPRFTGEVARPNARYSCHRFSFEECRARHEDVVSSLAKVYELVEEQP
eukprot:363371-Chlamydomonas_euryale.AAC.12